MEQTPQITPEMEYYENFEQSPEEMAEAEMMIKEDRKNELRRLAHLAGLRHETYYLINKQFEKEIARHPLKDVTERHFINKSEDYPTVLMINKPVDLDITLIKSEVSTKQILF
jgi:hypothetical protein